MAFSTDKALIPSSTPCSVIGDENTPINYQGSKISPARYIQNECSVHGIKDLNLEKYGKPVNNGVSYRLSTFDESECGEPIRNQHLKIDFSPIKGVDDNEYTIKKCLDFWALVKNEPKLKGFQVFPYLYRDDEIETTKKAENDENAAINWLKHDELMSNAFVTKEDNIFCVDGSDEYYIRELTQKQEKRSHVLSLSMHIALKG